MYYWQITKYDPKNRDRNGVYLKDEWIDHSDIGKTFDGKKLTFSEYFNTESKYIQAVLLFMESLNIDSLQATHLIDKGLYYDQEMVTFIVQSILRNKFGCKLEYDEKMYVHFGWDYYMYIGASQICKAAIIRIENLGLFVEKSERTFLFNDDEDDE